MDIYALSKMLSVIQVFDASLNQSLHYHNYPDIPFDSIKAGIVSQKVLQLIY